MNTETKSVATLRDDDTYAYGNKYIERSLKFVRDVLNAGWIDNSVELKNYEILESELSQYLEIAKSMELSPGVLEAKRVVFDRFFTNASRRMNVDFYKHNANVSLRVNLQSKMGAELFKIPSHESLRTLISQCKTYEDIKALCKREEFYRCTDSLRCRNYYLSTHENKWGNLEYDDVTFSRLLVCVDTFNVYLRVLFSTQNGVYFSLSDREREMVRLNVYSAFETCLMFYRSLNLSLACRRNENARGIPWYHREVVENLECEEILKRTSRNVDTIDDFYVHVAKVIEMDSKELFYPCIPGSHPRPKDTNELVWKSVYFRECTGLELSCWQSYSRTEPPAIEEALEAMDIY